ncbi:MAG: sulfotransferase [Hydrogenophilales bacterium]|nr:sulfotransferase [Hydrogenophilales bacterium]
MTKQNILTRGKKVQANQLALDGRFEEACTLYQVVSRTDPSDVEVWAKLGATQYRLGRYPEAEASARRALKLAPHLAFAQHTLALALQGQGKLDDAAALLEHALAQQPNSAETITNLARLREQQGRVQESFELYHRALDLQPDSAYVQAKRAELLEKAGQVEEAEAILARGLAREPGHPVLNLVAARLDRRAGRHAQAVTRLESILYLPAAQESRAEIHLLLGQLHDRLGNTDKVLPHLIEGKRRVALTTDPNGQSRSRFLARIETARAWMSDNLATPPSAVAQDKTPIFLVGFPRSGTTLLEQILDSHPRLQTLEEKPMAEVLEQAFLNLTGGGPDALANLSEPQLAHLREVYWTEAERLLDRQPGTLLVDKLPLNIVRIPLLWRVFPEARFILAIRHPCDVALSCLMQNFGHNDAMAGLVSLDSIAQIYSRVMGNWLDYAARLPLHWHRVRYEDLITNLEDEAHSLLDFLGVDWDDAVLSHTRHAQERALINTPSYHQVTQPIYQHARYRWKRYQTAFTPILPTLQPFIRQFGYSEADAIPEASTPH